MFALLASGLILAISLMRGFEFLEAFLFVLAAAVSAIPEGYLW
jgi:magnesium-transporting ATPase (P-type)